MTAELSSFTVGGVTFPLATGTGNALLRDADPALYFALAFWQAMLVQHAGPRLVAEFTAAGIVDAKGEPLTGPVATVVPYDPGPYLGETQFAFPLLAAFRKASRTKWFAAGFEHETTDVAVLYILPPLDSAQAEKILPILGAIYKVLRARTSQQFDPGYTPPGGSGPQPGPWTAGFANLESVAFTKCSHGMMPGAGTLVFPALLAECELVERDNVNTVGMVPYEGADIQVDLVARDQTRVPDLMSVSTQLAPAPTSLNIATGSFEGGTAVTITGTLFNPAWTVARGGVTFGGIPALSVRFVSPTSITCVTPTVSGPGAVDVVVTNGDGQSATLSGAFTYTSP